MRWIHSLGIAFSMYSKIPVPKVRWTNEAMQYTFCFFPLVGVAEGALLWGMGMVLYGLRDRNRLPTIFVAIVLTILPLLVTGGIHMDGFLDTTDARKSFLPKEKKLEILKDPRAGAFAVIGCGTYLLFYAALFSELDQRSVLLFSGAFLTERALSGMSVVSFPMAKKDGLAASFSQAALKRTVRLLMALYLAAGAAYFLAMGKVLFGSILPGWLCILAAGAVFAWYYRMACREFGGITGDLAGYFLQVCELLLLAVCVLCGWLYPA